MHDQTYIQILKMKALERWENEGGKIYADGARANEGRGTGMRMSTNNADRHSSDERR